MIWTGRHCLSNSVSLQIFPTLHFSPKPLTQLFRRLPCDFLQSQLFFPNHTNGGKGLSIWCTITKGTDKGEVIDGPVPRAIQVKNGLITWQIGKRKREIQAIYRVPIHFLLIQAQELISVKIFRGQTLLNLEYLVQCGMNIAHINRLNIG